MIANYYKEHNDKSVDNEWLENLKSDGNTQDALLNLNSVEIANWKEK